VVSPSFKFCSDFAFTADKVLQQIRFITADKVLQHIRVSAVKERVLNLISV
jgi:hypothetical protein